MPLFGSRRNQIDEKSVDMAMNALFAADTTDEIRSVLEKHQNILFSDQVFNSLREIIKHLKDSELPYAAGDFEQLLHLLEETHAYGIDTAWKTFKEQRRNEPPKHVAVETIGALMDIHPDDEKRRYMESYSSILLSNTAQSVTWLLRANTRNSKPLDSLNLELHLRLIEHARKYGIANALNTKREVATAIDTFINAHGWDGTRRILEEKQHLLFLDIAIIELQGRILWMQQKDNPLFQLHAQVLLTYLGLLEHARTHGIPAAWKLLGTGKLPGLTPPQLAKAEVKLRKAGIIP